MKQDFIAEFLAPVLVSLVFLIKFCEASTFFPKLCFRSGLCYDKCLARFAADIGLRQEMQIMHNLDIFGTENKSTEHKIVYFLNLFRSTNVNLRFYFSLIAFNSLVFK